MVCLTIDVSVNAQVSGFVFRDFNANGTKDNSASYNEPFVQGVTVKATLADGQSFSTTTDANGEFYFNGGQVLSGQDARIEFSGLKAGDHSSAIGSANGSNVQFVTAPATGVNYAINAPDDYRNNIATPDPTLMVVQQGRGSASGYNAGRFSVLQINNSTNGPSNPVSPWVVTIDTSKRAARFYQTGSVYGIAFQKKQERFFLTASLKRNFGMGPQGLGGVYFLSKSGSNWTFGGGFTLQGVKPSNSAALLDFGSVTRVSSPDTDDNYLTALDYTAPKSRDNDAFAKAATMSYGGAEADANSDDIYLINLYQKRLIVLDASAANATLNGASAATLGALTKAYDLASLPGYPAVTGAGNNMRPYGIRVYKGRGYIGVVSDAMNTQSMNDLKGYVLSFDPKNIAAGFTTEISINFSSFTGGGTGRLFAPWVTTWAQAGGSASLTPKFWPQPMLSDIEFNEDGSMDIGIRDRWGDQNSLDYDAWPSATHSGQALEHGDILHACYNGTSWILEGTSGSCDQPIVLGNPYAYPYNPGGFGNSYMNTGKEYYADISGDGENESAEGGLAKLMGSQKTVTTTYDPIGDTTMPSSKYWNTQGLHWNDNITGRKTQMARVAVTSGGSTQVGKLNGMGDIEFVTEYQPVQIGNRVWDDADGDGIQDANEAGIPNLSVALRSPGPDGIYNNGDDQTWNTTTGSTGSYYFDNTNVLSQDTRKPSSWTGVSGILPGYNYRLEIDTNQTYLSGYGVSAADITTDNIDNDASLSGSKAIVNLNTGFVDQNFDFGFKNLTSVGDYVWVDNNSNGLQEAGEHGVAGIVVSLYNSSNVKIGSATTDPGGHYLIGNVKPGNGYYMTFSKIPGGKFTIQNAAGALNSKPDSTGKTSSFNVAPGQVVVSMDAGLSAVVLPVRILDFTARRELNVSTVNWNISNNGNSRVELQRSFDGVGYETIYAMQQHSAALNYIDRYTDETPYNGKNYYRLKIIDEANGVLYSDVRILNFDPVHSISVYPNPVQSQLNIGLPGSWTNKPVTISFNNDLGQIMVSKKIISATQLITLDAGNLATGTYFLKLEQQGKMNEYRKIKVIH